MQSFAYFFVYFFTVIPYDSETLQYDGMYQLTLFSKNQHNEKNRKPIFPPILRLKSFI